MGGKISFVWEWLGKTRRVRYRRSGGVELIDYDVAVNHWLTFIHNLHMTVLILKGAFLHEI